MNDILFISNDYCTDLTDFIQFLERGVQNHIIRHEILAYYRDGVLCHWLQSNGMDNTLDDFSGNGDMTDNDVYDYLYRTITGKSSVINSLKSRFSDFVQITTVLFSCDGVIYEKTPNFHDGVSNIKIQFKILLPENNIFNISVNGKYTKEINPSSYKRNQPVEHIFSFTQPENDSLQITEGSDNILCSYKISDQINNVDITKFKKFIDALFGEFDKYSVDSFPGTITRVKDQFSSSFSNLESELIDEEVEIVNVILRQYWRRHHVNSPYSSTLKEHLNSNLQCFVCLKGILYLWTYPKASEGEKLSSIFFSRANDFEFTKQLSVIADERYPSLRHLEANKTYKFFSKGIQPNYEMLKDFLQWYFNNMMDFPHAFDRV